MFDQTKIVNSTITIFLGRNLNWDEYMCIARWGINTEYNPKRFHAIVMKMKIHNGKHVTALLFRTGRVVMTGAQCLAQAEILSQRMLQILNFALSRKGKFPKVCIQHFCIRNIVYSGRMPTRISIEKIFQDFHRKNVNLQRIKKCQYEPEIFPGLRIASTKGFAITIFVNGKFILTGLKSFSRHKFNNSPRKLLQNLSEYIRER